MLIPYKFLQNSASVSAHGTYYHPLLLKLNTVLIFVLIFSYLLFMTLLISYCHIFLCNMLIPYKFLLNSVSTCSTYYRPLLLNLINTVLIFVLIFSYLLFMTLLISYCHSCLSFSLFY